MVMGKPKSLLALVGAALVLTASGYAATGGVQGLRGDNRPSSPGNGHCGHDGGPPPCNGRKGDPNEKGDKGNKNDTNDKGDKAKPTAPGRK